MRVLKSKLYRLGDIKVPGEGGDSSLGLTGTCALHFRGRPIPRGVTQHMHIRGGKSDIFGLEYCRK